VTGSQAADRSETVADAMWDRVRRLAERVASLEEADAAGDLDEDGRARLVALRMRAGRAAERARLADELADQILAKNQGRADAERKPSDCPTAGGGSDGRGPRRCP
jgi:hypothetical protein